MSGFALINALPAEISEVVIDPNLCIVLSHILESVRMIGVSLRNVNFSTERVGSTNLFGDSQLDVDVKTDEIVFANLRKSGLVHVASSEEQPTEIYCGGNGYSVAFDPLDGSSIVDANFTVGSIFGVWLGSGFKGRTGSEQSSSLIALYGPRVSIALALNSSSNHKNQKLCAELTMMPDNWVVTRKILSIRTNGKTFAPGNLRATFDNPDYRALVSYWIDSRFTLRYTGGLVPDVYHILIKGEGVLSNASSPGAKAKLRLLYECAPIALVIEAAGGRSCVCSSEAAEEVQPVSILDVVISDLDKRIGVCYGSADEVQRFIAFMFRPK